MAMAISRHAGATMGSEATTSATSKNRLAPDRDQALNGVACGAGCGRATAPEL
jgi:hypothetical protein